MHSNRNAPYPEDKGRVVSGLAVRNMLKDSSRAPVDAPSHICSRGRLEEQVVKQARSTPMVNVGRIGCSTERSSKSEVVIHEPLFPGFTALCRHFEVMLSDSSLLFLPSFTEAESTVEVTPQATKLRIGTLERVFCAHAVSSLAAFTQTFFCPSLPAIGGVY